jgi:hypothetical protein
MVMIEYLVRDVRWDAHTRHPGNHGPPQIMQSPAVDPAKIVERSFGLCE